MPELSTMDDFNNVKDNYLKRTRAEYPDDWFDGNVRSFQRGKDFEIQPSSFVSMMHTEAKRRGIRIRTVKQDKDTVLIYAVLSGNR